MTSQEIFDTVVAHLRKQGRTSFRDESGICMYRGPDGLKCAVGVLIPDDLYAPEMEGQNVYYGLVNQVLKARLGFSDEQMRLANFLQAVHDLDTVEDWERKFKPIAEAFNLVYTPPGGE